MRFLASTQAKDGVSKTVWLQRLPNQIFYLQLEKLIWQKCRYEYEMVHTNEILNNNGFTVISGSVFAQ